jgi:tetratricopeptide (TPR) repeat protein
VKNLQLSLLAGVSFLLGVQGLSSAQETTHASVHRAITTRVPAAQQAFDDGLLMLYAFNMAEARIAFEKAAQLDPDCAMAYWGAAVSEVSDINIYPSREDELAGYHYLQRAMQAKEASAAERALIAALETRYAEPEHAAAERAAYVKAMEQYSAAHPKDADAHVHTAIAIWRMHEPNKTERMPAIGENLAQAAAVEPDNIGVHHMRVHYYENIGQAATALHDADVLYNLYYDVGESHLPHMAGHIYNHVGLFQKAVDANYKALGNDKAYFALGSGPGQKYMQFYHMHDLMNLFYAQTTIGEDAAAWQIASHEMPDDARMGETLIAVRDRRAPLAAEASDDVDEIVAVGVNAARHDDLKLASAESALLPNDEQHKNETQKNRMFISAAIAESQQQWSMANALYKSLYSSFTYDVGDPPNGWAIPIPEGYGATLLHIGHAAEAKRIFAEILRNRVDDPRALYGLSLAQQALHENFHQAREAARIHWRGTTPLSLNDLG